VVILIHGKPNEKKFYSFDSRGGATGGMCFLFLTLDGRRSILERFDIGVASPLRLHPEEGNLSNRIARLDRDINSLQTE
jgi:hypothetical protein